MTVNELYVVISRCLELHPNKGDAVVGVETCNGGCPTRYKSKVKSASFGFDWDHGNFILRTEEPLCCVRVLDQPIKELARFRLEKLKEFYGDPRRGGGYIAKAREKEWIDGFVAGVEYHITSANEPGEIVQDDDEKRK